MLSTPEFMAPFGNLICNIIGMRPDPEVQWVAARGIVAGVQNNQALFN
jgi:hypothetical protein